MKNKLIYRLRRFLAALVPWLCRVLQPGADRPADGCDKSFTLQTSNATIPCAVKTPTLPVARNGSR